jgi:hypothetical protein
VVTGRGIVDTQVCVKRERNLIVVLGDQLDLDAAAFDGFDDSLDSVWMAEAAEESTHVWSSKPRTVMFLAAMRHFALALRDSGRRIHYSRLDEPENCGSLGSQLQADVLRLRPAGLVVTEPGDWRVLQVIKAVARATGLPLDIREDRHFFCSVKEFAAHAKARKSLRMEYFYREQRQRHDVLMQRDETGASPVGGRWNFDADNREAFGAAGPGAVPPRASFAPDAVTREVALVETRFASHPGRLDCFAWPVTRAQALLDEVVQRLQCLIAGHRPGEAVQATRMPREPRLDEGDDLARHGIGLEAAARRHRTRAAGTEGLAVVGIEVPLATKRRVFVVRIHQHTVPLALLAIEVLHPQRLAAARMRRELTHADEEVAVLAYLQRQSAGIGHRLDRLQHAPVARGGHDQPGWPQALDVSLQLRGQAAAVARCVESRVMQRATGRLQRQREVPHR